MQWAINSREIERLNQSLIEWGIFGKVIRSLTPARPYTWMGSIKAIVYSVEIKDSRAKTFDLCSFWASNLDTDFLYDVTFQISFSDFDTLCIGNTVSLLKIYTVRQRSRYQETGIGFDFRRNILLVRDIDLLLFKK